MNPAIDGRIREHYYEEMYIDLVKKVARYEKFLQKLSKDNEGYCELGHSSDAAAFLKDQK